MKHRALLTILLCGGSLLLAIAVTAGPITPNTVTPNAATSKSPTLYQTPSTAIGAVRVKDITRIQSARDNQLMGYGLVVGLNGTGDGNNSEFTTLALSSMLQRLGLTVQSSRLKVKNVAAVMVTADIGPFLTSGNRIDVTVSSLGDATNLQGGILLQTPLCGADSKVYAVAQGSVSLGGFSAESSGSSKTSGHPTVGRIPNGALVEAEIPTELTTKNTLTLSLNAPDFTTASRLASAINLKMPDSTEARDAASIVITIPAPYHKRLVDFIALISEVTLVPDTVAKVVVNERTGTVVVGGNVTITPVAVAQGNLTVSVNAGETVSQPMPFSSGSTVTTPVAGIDIHEPHVSLTPIRGNTVEELVRSLNAMKVSPRDIIAILQALKQAGALQAELQIM
ncbi:MAG: flagellar basal body P-ring protein FlgI [Armatimonadota bacterium]